MGTASGIHVVPEPIRSMEIPKGLAALRGIAGIWPNALEGVLARTVAQHEAVTASMNTFIVLVW